MSKRNPNRNVRVRIQSPAPTPEHPGATYLDNDAETFVALPIRAWASGSGLPCDLEYLVDLDPRRDRPQFVMVELTLKPRRGDAVGTHILRAPLKIPELVSEAVAAAMTPQHMTQDSPWSYPVEAVRELIYVNRERRGQDPHIKDDQLPQVLRVWKANGGDNGGTRAVKEQWGVDRVTAWRTVQRAKEHAKKRRRGNARA